MGETDAMNTKKYLINSCIARTKLFNGIKANAV